MPATQNNLLASTRATFQIAELPAFEYEIQSFTLPGLNVTLPETPNPFKRIAQTPDTLVYEDMNVGFIVDHRLNNWIRIHDWIRSNAFPVEYREYKEKKFSFSDATMIMYSNKHNPVLRAEFKNCFPRFLSGVDFDVTDTGTVIKKANMSLSFDYYNIISYE